MKFTPPHFTSPGSSTQANEHGIREGVNGLVNELDSEICTSGLENLVGNWRSINHPIACQFSTLALIRSKRSRNRIAVALFKA